MSKGKHTDILVIGSGPGGYAAAFRAADLGREVTLVDKDPTLGGVCLNRGCIPSKTLLHIAKVLEEADSLKKMGVTFSKPSIDIDLVREWKNKVVSQLSGGIGQMAKARKVNTIQAKATFLSDTETQQLVVFFNICHGTRDISLHDMPPIILSFFIFIFFNFLLFIL